ncbi:MAG TPA: hypothetical protein VH682_24915 [Gemmataceae bacterium]|jgi:hypothetical protein
MYNVVWTAPLRRVRPFVSALALAALVSAASAADDVKDAKRPVLEEALPEQVPQILDKLRKEMDHPKDALHVGVLKFHIQTGKETPRGSAAAPTLYVTRRLEAALILSLKEEDKVRVLHNPSAEVTNLCNLQKEQGRKAFFQEGKKLYHPAWGNDDEVIPAHVFLTGLVKIDDACRTAEVVVQAFDRRGETPKEVCRFPIATDPRLLAEAGINCVISRGTKAKDWEVVLADTSKGTPEGDTDPSAKKLLETKKLLDQSPIDVQILYKGKPQKVRDDGTVREPREGEVVTFRLKHKNKDEKTYGVLLKVNGQNTCLTDGPDADDFLRCWKWIVKPGEQWDIEGYQINLDEAKAFKVAGAADSQRDAVSYGENAGLFTILVFEGRSNDEKDQIVEAHPVDVVAIGRGVPNRLKECGTLAALQGHLKNTAKDSRAEQKADGRGMVLPGQRKQQKVEQVTFRASMENVPVIQIRYYKPSGEK